jgi:small subunit ribosomal protein S17
MTDQNKKQRMLEGVIVSDKMNKTVVVQVASLKKHPKYKKYFKVTRKFKAHNPEDQYHTGDRVVIGETRPLSKEKRWIVLNKIN